MRLSKEFIRKMIKEVLYEDEAGAPIYDLSTTRGGAQEVPDVEMVKQQNVEFWTAASERVEQIREVLEQIREEFMELGEGFRGMAPDLESDVTIIASSIEELTSKIEAKMKELEKNETN